MGRPKGKSSDQETEERLLSAAEGEFSRRGYDGARLEDIASAVGIRRPSLLYHFGSKDDLYRAVVERAFGKLSALLAAAMQNEGSFAERLGRLVDDFVRFLAESPTIAPLFLREILDGRGPGQELLRSGLSPILDQVERFVAEQGGSEVPQGFPIREAVMQIAVSELVRSAAGALREPLWGRTNSARALALALVGDKG